MKNDLFLIDTNILVYAYDTSEKKKCNICKDLIRKCWKNEKKYAISLQNLSEFYVIITNKIERPITERDAAKRIERIIEFSNWIKIKPDSQTILDAIKLNARYRLPYWDALLAATMKENGILGIYTEDTHFKKIPWLEVINPIR